MSTNTRSSEASAGEEITMPNGDGAQGQQRVYISGPMSGHPEHNYPAFRQAAAVLRAKGYAVISPAETGGVDLTKHWSNYIKTDLMLIMSCVDVIAVLPGWQDSRGAMLEVALATFLEIPICDYESGGPLSSKVALKIDLTPTVTPTMETKETENKEILQGAA